MQIGFAVLYLYPRTMKLGLCYDAGAVATELSHNMPLNTITPLVLIRISALLQDKSIYIPTANPA